MEKLIEEVKEEMKEESKSNNKDDLHKDQLLEAISEQEKTTQKIL